VGGSNARVLQIKKMPAVVGLASTGPAVAVAPLATPSIYQSMPIAPDFNPR